MRDVMRPADYGQHLVGCTVFVTGDRDLVGEAVVEKVEQPPLRYGFDVTVRYPDERGLQTLNSLRVQFLGPEYRLTKWCPECRRTKNVEDRHDESAYVGTREFAYWVNDLECGHSVQEGQTEIGPSPGGESLAEAVSGLKLTERLDRAARSQE